MTTIGKVGIWELGIEDFNAKYELCIFRTDETRHKRVDSLKACKLKSQLTMSEPRASSIAFFQMC